MTARLLVVAILALPVAPLAAELLPSTAATNPHIQMVEYGPDQVVHLQVAPGYQLTVALSPDEQVRTVAVGDTGAWQVATNHGGDHLFIKLAQGGGTTDMTVVTTIRNYVFELTPLAGPTADMAYTVQFRYPISPSSPTAVAAKSVAGRYRVSGARALRPSRISDDGSCTFVEWPKDVDLPAVYRLDRQGREGLINGMMRDDRLVIDAVEPRLVFRIDRQVARAERVPPRSQSR